MNQPLGQSGRLHGENLLATVAQRGGIGRNEGTRLNRAGQLQRHVGQLEGNATHRAPLGVETLCKRVLHPPLATQPLHIDFAYRQAGSLYEAFGLSQYRTILHHDTVPGENQVGRRLAKPGRGVDIPGQTAGRLLPQERKQVVVLPDQLVRSREVEKDIGSLPRLVGAGGNGDPQVFAQLNPDYRAGTLEEQVGTEGNPPAAQIDRLARDRKARGKPTLLVKLFVIGQIALGYHAQNLAPLKRHGAVVQTVAPRHRYTRHTQQRARGGRVEQLRQSLLCLLDQQGVPEQVATGISRNRQFGKDDDLHAQTLGLGNLSRYLLGIISAIGHLHTGDSRRHFYESEILYHILSGVSVDKCKKFNWDYNHRKPYSLPFCPSRSCQPHPKGINRRGAEFPGGYTREPHLLNRQRGETFHCHETPLPFR